MPLAARSPGHPHGSAAVNAYLHSKFVLACATFVAALVLLLLGKLSAEQWVNTVTWLLGLYYGADVAASAVAKGTPP